MAEPLVGVIDYDAGNLRSVETALETVHARFTVSADPDELRSSDRLIFPGVGDAAAATQTLRERGLDELIREFARSGKRVFGICLGSQIVLDRSEENGAVCLGLIRGEARRFRPVHGEKVPHMGWNRVHRKRAHPLFEGIPEDASYYFVHSYFPQPESKERVIAKCDYIESFAAAISLDNIWAVQFHPEKSGRFGLQMLANFLSVPEFEGEGD